jgi:uncharacterized protein (TIGR00266 family)
MQIELLHQPGNTAARVTLAPGETITSESGAMIAMSGNMDITTSTHKKKSGGLLKAAKRMLAGESFFLNHFESSGQAGEVIFGTGLAGDMMVRELEQESLIVQSRSFLAATDDIDIGFGWQGFASIFSGESVFWLNLKGSGSVVLTSFGAIYPVVVDGDYIVDTGHIVAFEETLDFTITKAGKSWLHSYLGGEGLVCKFSGTGTVWCQSHSSADFGQRLAPSLKNR